MSQLANQLVQDCINEVDPKLVSKDELRVAKKFKGELHGANKGAVWFYFPSKELLDKAWTAFRKEGYAPSAAGTVASKGKERPFVLKVS